MSTVPKYLPSYTIDDYQKWEGNWELIDGVPLAMSSPFAPQERIVTRLARMLGNAIENQKCQCEVYTNLDWIVTKNTVIRPDLMVVCDPQPMRHLERPPAFMAEVLSTYTRLTDLNTKRSIAQQNGVKNYLILCPDEKTILEASGAQVVDIDPSSIWTMQLCDGCEIQIDATVLFD